METKLLNSTEVELAADLIKNEEVVGFPTETVYGLGVLYDSEKAFKKMMEAKNRPPHKPFTLMCDSINMIKKFVNVNEKIEKFLNMFMPGPLTVLLKTKKELPSFVTLGSEYVGIRISSHPFVLNLIKKVGKPLLVPSANKSGEKPLSEYEDVINAFSGEISAVVMEDALGELPSTIIKIDEDIELVRQGSLTLEELNKTWREL
ncbi:MAG: L-threonylcarbamoyladenylate synthase [Bacilli bacterium]